MAVDCEGGGGGYDSSGGVDSGGCDSGDGGVVVVAVVVDCGGGDGVVVVIVVMLLAVIVAALVTHCISLLRTWSSPLPGRVRPGKRDSEAAPPKWVTRKGNGGAGGMLSRWRRPRVRVRRLLWSFCGGDQLDISYGLRVPSPARLRPSSLGPPLVCLGAHTRREEAEIG